MSVADSGALSTNLLAIRAEFDDVFRFGFAKLLAASGGRERLAHFLLETWHYVRFSVPLLERAATRLGGEIPGLRAWFEKHAVEEKDHDEWLLDDLESLGVPRAAARATRPGRETAELVGTQLLVLETQHPAALLGYVFAMESRPPTPAAVASLASAFGVPEGALGTLRAHGSTDPGHLAEILRVADSLPVGQIPGLVAWNARLASAQAADVVLAAAVRDLGA